MADLSEQVRLQQELNEAISQRNALITEQNKLLNTQSDLSGRIGKSLSNPATTRRVRDMTSAIRTNNEAIEDGTDKAEELEDALNEAADAADSSTKSFNLLSLGFGAMKGLFSGAVSIFKNIGSALFDIAASLLKTAISIISFPFKLFGTLVDLAQKGGGGRPMAEAWEEVRDVLGDLATGPAASLERNFKGVKKEAWSLAKTGLSVRNIFGRGRQGMAAMLKDLAEFASAAGDQFSRLQSQFESMGSKAIIFQRGLAMSKEEFTELSGIVKSRGLDIEKYMTEFSRTSVQTAKAFGLGVKDVSKGMKELVLDITNFGHLGPKAFAPITVYARKLGLEIKNMAGIMGKFAGFADTTEAASKMAQTFNMNVDAMKLMSAQNPAEKIEILRRAFFRTGKDIKNMSYQQRQYLEGLTGLEGKSFEAAFSLEQQGISYGNIAKESKKAKKSQLSQKVVLKELSKGIKRLIETMSGPKVTGFFDAFVKGFERGILRSEGMQDVFINIRNGLRQMRWSGERVGKMFIKYFPGIGDMLRGISELLAPENFERFIRKVEPAFKQFFLTQDFNDLMDGLVTAFKGDMGPGGKAFKKIVSGFWLFLGGMAKVLATFLGKVMDDLVTPAMAAWGRFMLEVEADAKNEKGAFAPLKSIVKILMKKIEAGLGASGFGKNILKILKPFADVFSGDNNPWTRMAAAYTEAAGPTKRVFNTIGKDVADAIIGAIKDAFNKLSIMDLLAGAGILGFLMNPVGFIAGVAKFGWKTGAALIGGGRAAVGAATGMRGAQNMGFMSRLMFGRSKKDALIAATTAAKVQATASVAALRKIAPMTDAAASAAVTSRSAFLLKGSAAQIEAGTSEFLRQTGTRMQKMMASGSHGAGVLKGAAERVFPWTSKLMSKSVGGAKWMAGTANRFYTGTATQMNRAFSASMRTGGSMYKVASNTMPKFAGAVAKAATVGRAMKIPGIVGAIATGAKKIPVIGTLIAGLFAGVESAFAKEGEGTAVFFSSLVSTLTLGVFSTAEVQDAFTGSTKMADELYRTQSAEMQASIEEAYRDLLPALETYRGEIVKAQQDLQHTNQNMIIAIATGGVQLSDAEMAAVTKADQARRAHATKGSSMIDIAKERTAQWARERPVLKKLAAQILDESDDDFTDNIEGTGEYGISIVDLGEETKRALSLHFAAKRKAINDLGHDQVESHLDDFGYKPGGLLYIHNDYFDQAGKANLLNLDQFILDMENATFKGKKSASLFAKKSTAFLQDFEDKELRAYFSAVQKSGDSKVTRAIMEEQTSRSQRAIEKEIGIRGGQSTRSSGTLGRFYSQTQVDQDIERTRRVSEHLTKALGLNQTAEAAQEVRKLSDLQMQRTMIQQIKSMSHIPQELQKARKELEEIDLDTIKADTTVLVGQAMAVVAGIDAAFKESEVKGMTQSSKDAITALNDLGNNITPLAGSLDTIVTAFGKIKALIKTKLFGRRYKVSTFTAQIRAMANDIVALPVAILSGLSPLLPDDYTPPAEMDPTLGSPAEATQSKIPEGYFERQEVVVTRRLREIADFIGPVAKDLGTVSSSVKLIKGTARAFPSMSIKEKDVFNAKLVNTLGLVNSFIAAIVTDPKAANLGDAGTGTKLSMTKTNVVKTHEILAGIKKSGEAARKIKPKNLTAMKTVGKTIVEFVTDLQAAAVMIAADEFEPVKPIIDGLAAFGGGNLVLHHNMPNTKILLNVNINAKRFAKQLVDTPLKTTAGKEVRLQTGETKSALK